MVIKVYISGISGNKEVKKRQQRVQLILDSKSVKYEVIDIAEPGAEEAKDFMQNAATSLGCTISDPNPRHPLPPQIFNDEEYCGDYDQFDTANEIDEMEQFLKLPESDTAQTSTAEIKLKNGVSFEDKICVREIETTDAGTGQSYDSLDGSADSKGIPESKSEESAKTDDSVISEESCEEKGSVDTKESVETQESEDKDDNAVGARGDDNSDCDSELSESRTAEEKADEA